MTCTDGVVGTCSLTDASLRVPVPAVLGWYDHEWDFSNRLLEFSERIGAGAVV
jgi:hypothetical protein